MKNWIENSESNVFLSSNERYLYNRKIEESDIFNKTLNRDGLILSQKREPVSKMKYGTKYTLSYNGCELIAVYNALNLMGYNHSLSRIIYEFEINKATAYNLSVLKTHPTAMKIIPYILFLISKLNFNFKSGMFGTNPYAPKRFFDKHNYIYEFTDNINEFETLRSDGGVYIMTCWNEKRASSKIHTFALTADKMGCVYSFNGYYDNYKYKSFDEILNKSEAGFICGFLLKGRKIDE